MSYKPAKTVSQQVQYLHDTKRVQFNKIDEEQAKNILFKYNYINVITPYKHHFAKLNDKKEVAKENGSHVYERDVEFSEYYDKYKEERSKYPLMIKNIIGFETIFKSIVAYRVFTSRTIEDHDSLYYFLETVRVLIPNNNPQYSPARIKKLNQNIEKLQRDIDNYADMYCFFDHMSLGEILTIYCGLDYKTQDTIFSDCNQINMCFNVDKTPDFITKIFTLVSVRNCVMHCNSIEILIRFFDPKKKLLRDSTNKKRFVSMINYLSKEKDYTKMV